MLKNSGTQEKNRKAYITGNIIVVIQSFLGKKINIIDFLRIIPFLAINKLRRSVYASTLSGIPKLKLWLSLLIPKLFSYPLKKEAV